MVDGVFWLNAFPIPPIALTPRAIRSHPACVEYPWKFLCNVPFLCALDEIVFRQREVVHTNVNVFRCGEFFDRMLKNLELRLRRRDRRLRQSFADP